MSNNYVVHLKLTPCCMETVIEKKLNPQNAPHPQQKITR